MKDEYGEVNEDSIRELILQVVEGDRKLLYKTIGLYYLVWDIAVAVFIFSSYILNEISNYDLSIVAFSIIYGLVSFFNIYYTYIIFKKVRSDEKLQNILGKRK